MTGHAGRSAVAGAGAEAGLRPVAISTIRERREVGMGKISGAVSGSAGDAAMSVPQLAKLSSARGLGPRVHLANGNIRQYGPGAEASLGWTGLTLRVLLSYHYYQGEEIGDLVHKYFGGVAPDIFLDSGAYSASTKGAVIQLAEYIAYIERNREWLTTYANLDVIGDHVATLDNQRRMEDAGLSPLPVFHMGEPWSALEYYLERYQYIALGGMVRVPVPTLGRWLVRCFQAAGDAAVFHGFGITSWPLLKDFRWYSADSSSWGYGFRFGKVPIFDDQRGRIHRVRLGNAPDCYRQAHVIRAMGFDPADFADRSRNDHDKICAISAMCYMMAERWLRRRWGDVEIGGRASRDAPEEVARV